MADMSVNICGVDFKNPVIPASGAFGYGREYEELFPLSNLGGIATKGTTLHKRTGNLSPRIAETPAGMLNSVGLQNPGIDHFINVDLPYLMTKDVVILANIAGSTPEECAEAAAKLEDTDVHMIELNISCPNVKQGGAAFGTSCEMAAEVTKSKSSYKKAAYCEAFAKCYKYSRYCKSSRIGRCGRSFSNKYAAWNANRYKYRQTCFAQ